MKFTARRNITAIQRPAVAYQSTGIKMSGDFQAMPSHNFFWWRS
jgi:hypothetical protein